MKERRNSWCLGLGVAILLLGSAGCGGLTDGGVGGTGIATVRGNVLDPDLTAVNRLAAGNDGGGASAANITVRVQDTDVSDITDEAGVFELTGAIAGDITLEFSREDRPVAATLRLVVPADAEVTLQNVELVDDTAEPEQILIRTRTVTTGQIVGAAACEGNEGSFVLRDDEQVEYTVLITAETVIRLESGAALTCEDLSERSRRTQVRGLQDGHEITAEDIRVQSRGSFPPP